jgi:hypothetical protein
MTTIRVIAATSDDNASQSRRRASCSVAPTKAIGVVGRGADSDAAAQQPTAIDDCRLAKNGKC